MKRLWQKTMRRTLTATWSALALLLTTTLQRVAMWWCGTARVTAALWLALLRRCGTAVVARVVATLWRYNSRCYNAATLWRCRYNSRCCHVATLWRCSSRGCDAAALRMVALRHCGVTRGCDTTSGVIVIYLIFLNDSWQVQESSTSFPLRARNRETESKKEQERALKLVLVLVFQTFPLSSDPSLVGWQRCKNISSLQPAPSSSANNISSKKKFKNSTAKEFCYFQH